MTLERFEVKCVRNIASATLSLSPGINILYGTNGSGKTSVLEALSLLGLGRSFRTTRLNTVLQHGSDISTVFGLVDTDALVGKVPIGINRYRGGKREIQIAGKAAHLASQLAELLPVQIMTPESVQLLTGPPSGRRRFLNWGVFHVEHSFKKAWRNAEHSLRQRNTLLRHAKIDLSMLETWTHQLVETALEIDQYRLTYLKSFLPLFEEVLSELLVVKGIELSYAPGWDRSAGLANSLKESIERDRKQGFTGYGHHRADLMLKVLGRNAIDVLSRGEQKLVACALMMTQGRLMERIASRHCTYLIDDLGSELDSAHQHRLWSSFERMNSQAVITALSKEIFAPFSTNANTRLFHVKHGTVASDEV